MASKNARLSQSQLLLPILDALDAAGGSATTANLYAATAERLQVGADERAATVTVGGHVINTFERSVRWAQQRARLMALATTSGNSTWSLTTKGSAALTQSTPGKIVTVWTTANGVALWADCSDAVGMIDPRSVQLVLTSPPYPINLQKAYGGYTVGSEGAYIEWLLRLADEWGKVITDDGSVAINLGDAWIKGHPRLSLYQEKLMVAMNERGGWHLCQRFQWYNSAAMPAPAAWCCVRRIRVKQAVETVWWLSRSDDPYADNRQVLRPYSRQMEDAIKAGGQGSAHRPSGHDLSEGAFGAHNGGSVPPNLIVAANTSSNDSYANGCRAAGLDMHPARFPRALPDFMIKLLTRERDLVYDPMAGSGTTAASAEALGRRWITSERVREYVEGARFRFETNAVMAA